MKKRLLRIGLAIAGIGLVFLVYHFTSPHRPEGKNSIKEETKIHLPDPKNIETDEETGLQVENNVILITFSRFTDDATVNRIIKEIGGEIVGFEQDSNFFQVRLPEADLSETKKKCLKLLGSYREVEYAIPNTISKADNPYWEDGSGK